MVREMTEALAALATAAHGTCPKDGNALHKIKASTRPILPIILPIFASNPSMVILPLRLN